MLKKLSILFSLALVALGINAQLPVGTWTMHPTFNGITTLAETQGMVYYLSGTSLYSVDKKTGEQRALNIANDLNGGNITNIYPHPEGKYLIVTYSDCNIDRIDNDGTVYNLSDIKDGTFGGNLAINHVGFGKDKIYVSTTFGLVTYNDKKNEVRETMFTADPVTCAYGLGDKIIISYDKKLMVADASKKIISLDQFNLVGDNSTEFNFSNKGTSIGDNRLLLISTSNTPVVAHFDFEENKLIYFTNNPITGVMGVFNMGKDQAVAYNTSAAVTYNPTDNPASPTKITLPTSVRNHRISAIDGWDKTWAGNTDGIAEFDISDLNNPVQLCDKFGTATFATPSCNRIVAQTSGDILFWSETTFPLQAIGSSTRLPLTLTNYNPEKGFTKVWPQGTAIAEPSYLVQDPLDPDTYYICEFWKALHRVRNGKIDFSFNYENSGINCTAFPAIGFMGFDNFNNFWVVQEKVGDKASVHAIPYSELIKENPSKEAWRHFDISNLYRTSPGTMLNKSNRIACARGVNFKHIHIIDTKGTASLDDDSFISFDNYINQDGNPLAFAHVVCLTEDKLGRLWVGTNNGIFEITDPSKVTEGTTLVKQLKVPRNDGTNLADYLLESQTVSGIACDNSNRKWISTTTDGIYLVSPDGDQILEHYTMENSILPSNKVWSVACDPNSSSVFFATEAGVIEYNSTSAPAMTNLNDVYAFPNPVRPDYSGWITVTGLMDNTLVKIADAAGNVFFQGRSEGGMITWDGCNAAGERVKTGVYYVFASHGTSSESSSDSCVTKIMVIN